VLTGSSNTIYVAPSYLLFTRGQTLMAQPFDATKAQLSGDPLPIAQNVDHPGSLAAFSSSQNGVLAYSSGGSGSNVQLNWLDRSGKPSGTVGTPATIFLPAISPDGANVVFSRQDPQAGTLDIWLHELARNSDSRFTFGPTFNEFAVWSPDGKYIAYLANDKDGFSIHRKATSGVVQDEVLDADARLKRPLDWSHDGQYIIEEVPSNSKTGIDVWVLPLGGDKKAFPYLNTEANEGNAKLSPDGQFLAYQSDESKRDEIYVQTFPKQGGKWEVSTNGGSYPTWSRDGKELFFLAPDGKMMAAEVKSVAGKDGATFERSVPKPLFDTHIPPNGGFDEGKDGKFLVPVPVEQPGAAPINGVVNWTATLKR
jgi:Tol biopolymer transport system component